MMKRFAGIILGSVVLAGCSGPSTEATPKSGEASGSGKASAPGGFDAPLVSPPGFDCRVRLPEPTKRVAEKADLPDGGKLNSVTFTAFDAPGQATCSVGYAEFPASSIAAMGDVDGALDRAAEGAVAPYKGKITKIEPITISGAPGRAFSFEADNEAGFHQSGMARIALRGNRLYQVMYVTTMTNKADRAAGFVASFELTPSK